jgi:hypothetical protein
MLNIFQLNIGKSEDKTLVLQQYAADNDIDLISVHEPYINNFTKQPFNPLNNYFNAISKYNPKSTIKSTIYIRKNSKCLLDNELTNEDNVIIILDKMVILSTYFNLKEDKQDRDIQKDIKSIEMFLNIKIKTSF